MRRIRALRHFEEVGLPLFRAFLLLIALAAPALAQDESAIAAASEDAANQLQSYLDSVATAGKRPDFSKPPASDLFGQVFDLKQLAALPPSQAGEVGWLLKWLAAASSAEKSITFFDVTLSSPPTADQAAAVRRNLSDYEDQQTVGLDFIIRLSARMAQSLVLFMNQLPLEQRTPVRQEGLNRAQKGVAETIYGALASLAQGMKPANARRLSGAISDTSQVWASFIRPQDRPQIMSQIAAAQKAVKDDGTQENLAAFGATLAAAK